MIRKLNIIFCENEHGNGERCFPDIYDAAQFDLAEAAVQDLSVAQVRREAKRHGWGRVNGGDFCPSCMESM